MVTKTSNNPKTRIRLQSLNRALDILETLAEHGSLGVTESAKLVGLHVSTTHGIMRTLHSRNYLVNRNGNYRVGPALAALAGRRNVLADLPAIAQPHLDKITYATGESAVVDTLSGMRGVVLAATPSADRMCNPRRNDRFEAVLRTAAGRVLVAYLPEKEWNEHIDAHAQPGDYIRHLPRRTPAEWKADLRAIREVGYCEAVAEGGDWGAVAAPIRDATGIVIAALGATSTGGLRDLKHRAKLWKLVLEAGQAVSCELGYSPERVDAGASASLD